MGELGTDQAQEKQRLTFFDLRQYLRCTVPKRIPFFRIPEGIMARSLVL